MSKELKRTRTNSKKHLVFKPFLPVIKNVYIKDEKETENTKS